MAVRGRERDDEPLKTLIPKESPNIIKKRVETKRLDVEITPFFYRQIKDARGIKYL